MTPNRLFIQNRSKYANPVYEFHIAKSIRKKYGVEEYFFSINGNVIFANFAQVRNFVYKLNQKREDSQKVGAGQINAAGLLDEIYHYVLRKYEEDINPGVFDRALETLNEKVGEENLRKLIFEFVELFPPIDVYKGQTSIFNYLDSFSGQRSNYLITLEELITLHFANLNPANKKIIELFDSSYFSNSKILDKVIRTLDLFFQKEAKIGHDNHDVFTFLMIPILKHPDSIEAQLDYIKEKWDIILDEKFLKKLLSSKDLIKEDYIIDFHGGGGLPPTIVPKYKDAVSDAEFGALGKSGFKYGADSVKGYEEPEKFTQDQDWMPRLVLLAKNVYVWLDQLSKKYQRDIQRLDEIPDEELDLIAGWNFTGLWLIGIWERSSASKKIKHYTGNSDAAASAYSLYDYQIAWDLGGEDAFKNLDWRTKQRGIRLACDMVPNHTGIYSKWVVEHPEYFVQSPYSPFPNYRFDGPNLSEDDRIQVKIEDGYWRKSDAAVVFQRVDNNTGNVTYIYHGNDGTNMPWNDTAQLNLLKKEVREAVIGKIFEVARRFSVIRFDAAMTLTKKHFSRLWYPEPGRGGDIPSRSDYALTRDEFDVLFPEEFWREVVDRINNELPNTLLLAEAFWLMEGFFVRTLGMHRVYNSAFMHMMLKEENDKYRQLITNTLEFEPEILKRYVNFMSNPDEETAIRQFGSGDKYIGICVLMVTLPGLPMFGHGQIEGFSEKYGMEYKRSYYNEEPDQELINKHTREIFPLIKRRYLFSQVVNFWFFDFIADGNYVDENIYAFSNLEYGERALVFYNNRYSKINGKINLSRPKLISGHGGNKELKKIFLHEALQLKSGENIYYVFKEHKASLQYIKHSREFFDQGFSTELSHFEYKVFMDFVEIVDINGDCNKLYNKLGTNGTGNIFYSLEEIHFENFHIAFENLLNRDLLNSFIRYSIELESDEQKPDISFLDVNLMNVIVELKKHFTLSADEEKLLFICEKELGIIKSINQHIIEKTAKKERLYFQIKQSLVYSQHHDYIEHTAVFVIWYVVTKLSGIAGNEYSPRQFIDDTYLYNSIRNILRSFGKGEQAVEKSLNLLLLLSDVYRDFLTVAESKNPAAEFKTFFVSLFNNPLAKTYLNVNRHENETYFGKEGFDELVDWLFSIALFELLRTKPDETEFDLTDTVIPVIFKLTDEIKSTAVNSGFKLDAFISLLEDVIQ